MAIIFLLETKRLLQEVENIQRTYQHRTVNQLAFEIGLKHRFEDGEDTENIVDNKSAKGSSIEKAKHRKSSKLGKNREENNQEGTYGSLKCLQLDSNIPEMCIVTKDQKHILESPKCSASSKEANLGKRECSSSAPQKIISNGTPSPLPSNTESITTSCTTTMWHKGAGHKSKRVRKVRQVTNECLLSITSGREKRQSPNKATANVSAPVRENIAENENREQENPTKNNCKYRKIKHIREWLTSTLKIKRVIVHKRLL